MANTLREILSALVAVFLPAGCEVSPETVTVAQSAEPETAAIILFTSDVHGRIISDTAEPSWGIAAVAKEKQSLIDQGFDTWLFSCGDDSQGNVMINMDQGASVFRFTQKAGYDLMTVGNHEFGWGVDNLMQNIESVSFPVLAANITKTDDGSLLLEDNQIFETSSGMKIGVFGLDTAETVPFNAPANVAGLNFASGEELYECAQNQIDILKQEGCTVIICLGHMGINEFSAPDRSTDVIQNTTGINVFIDAHSHNEVNETVNDTLLVQTGNYGHNLGKLIIMSDGSISAELIPAATQAEAVNQDESLAAETASWYKTVTDSMSEAMATSEVELDGNETNTRSKETNLADLILDAMVYEVQLHSADTVDAAIMNGAAITKSISAGDVSILDVLNVFPFEDNIVTFKVTGAEILEALEVTTYGLPEPTTSFPQVSGIVYSVDTSVPFEKGEQYSDTAYYRPANPGARITIDSIGGQPYDAEKLYTIASDDFVGSGGSGYLAFKDAYEANGYNLDIQVADAVMDYIKNKLNGVIGQEYAEAQGRITIY